MSISRESTLATFCHALDLNVVRSLMYCAKDVSLNLCSETNHICKLWGGRVNTKDCMQNCWLFKRKRSIVDRFFGLKKAITKSNATFPTFRLFINLTLSKSQLIMSSLVNFWPTPLPPPLSSDGVIYEQPLMANVMKHFHFFWSPSLTKWYIQVFFLTVPPKFQC